MRGRASSEQAHHAPGKPPVRRWYQRGSLVVLAASALFVGVLGAGASTTGAGRGSGSGPEEVALGAGAGSEGLDQPHAGGDGHAHRAGDGHGHEAGGAGAHTGSHERAHPHGDHAAEAGGHDHDATGSGGGHGGHSHDHGGGSGGGGHDHGGGSGGGGHDHGGGSGGGGHDHGGGSGGGGHDHGGGSGTGATPDQQARAAALLAATEASVRKWSSTSAAYAAGFRSIGDAVTGFEHWVNWEWFLDSTILDPERPESLVYRVLPGGGRVLESAMYILPLGATMADVPDVGGPLTPWHLHDNLCWDFSRPTPIVVALTVNGVCPMGTLFVTPPMLHVWIVDTPCGRFAEIEGVQGTASCDHHHQG